MRAEYINPFVESIYNVCATMLHTPVKREQLQVSMDGFDRNGETLTSLIGISGEASGVVALCFPRPTALKLANRFLSSDFTDIAEEVTDALAELANMVAGSAKAKFNVDPAPELSLPTVIEGNDYKMKFPTKSAWVKVLFTSDAGEFTMELSFSTK